MQSFLSVGSSPQLVGMVLCMVHFKFFMASRSHAYCPLSGSVFHGAVLGVNGEFFVLHAFLHAEDCCRARHFVLHPPCVWCSRFSPYASSLHCCMAYAYYLHVSLFAAGPTSFYPRVIRGLQHMASGLFVLRVLAAICLWSILLVC